MRKARERRETFHQALLTATGSDANWKRQVMDETGTAATPDEVADPPGEVDRLGGVCLWLLKRLTDTFEAGHKADPSIPRLPVISLRSVLRRGTRKKPASKTKPAAPPAPPPNG